ncbi:hypothetical protein LV779_02500 [Streptomyces thinghirensis]|nr:hypothetical protein [Streptomyces thinghirensis]
MPRELTDADVERTIDDYARTARLAREARARRRRDHGLRGLPDQRVHRRATNHRTDRWGRATTRTACASPSRSSAGCARRSARTSSSSTGSPMLDPGPGRLPPSPRSWPSPRPSRAAGATIINTGIGWRQARIPTIATSIAAQRTPG